MENIDANNMNNATEDITEKSCNEVTVQQDRRIDAEDYVYHKKYLRGACRICGTRNLHNSSRSKDFFSDELFEVFEIDIQFDEEDIHPYMICRSHEILLKRYQHCKEKNSKFQTGIVPLKFIAHHENCIQCKPRKGRKRKPPVVKNPTLRVFEFERVKKMESQFEDVREAEKNVGDLSHNRCADTPPSVDDVIGQFSKLGTDNRMCFLKTLVDLISSDELSDLVGYIGKTQEVNLSMDMH